MEQIIQTQPRLFWIDEIETACVRAGVAIEWLRERFHARMIGWYNAGETVSGAVDMILFTWKQEPKELRADADDLGPIRAAAKSYSAIQVEAFEDYAERCPHRHGASSLPRPANALNIETAAETAPRCSIQPPADWPKVGTASANSLAFRWVASGGSPLVFGRCVLGQCPLQPRFCRSCGHRQDAGHALGVCRTVSEGPGGSWPCGCNEFKG